MSFRLQMPICAENQTTINIYDKLTMIPKNLITDKGLTVVSHYLKAISKIKETEEHINFRKYVYVEL